MLQAILVAVSYSMRHPWRVIAVGIAIAALSGAYASQRFEIDTNTNDLISRELPWRKREIDYQKAFPKSMDLILVVVEAPTPEQSAFASHTLAEALSKKPALFRSVEEEGGGPFFAKNRFLFLPLDQLKGAMTELTEAAPLIKTLVRDPSLRGLLQTLIMGLRGAQSEGYPLDAAGASRKQPIAGRFDLSSVEPRSPHGCNRGGGIGALSRGGKADRGET